MKPALALFLALTLAAPATMAANPQGDAKALLAWLHKARVDVNRAGKSGDKVALQRIKRDAYQRFHAWPDDARHADYMDCHSAVTDMIGFLEAYERKDYTWRDRKQRHFQQDLASCERAVKK
ncbi:hypothetical protein CEK28_04925 [Xenophilus sp. AP218F]|nr:hypothetical protein CEK28_04925 [Xenophilus sp. AP218F]